MTRKTLGTVFLLAISFTLSAQKNKAPHDVTFIQGDSVYKITNDVDSIVLDKVPFTIRYFGKQYTDKKSYSTRVAVLEQHSDLAVLAIGKSTKSVPYFEPGSGIAAGRTGYEAMFITNTGHHYLMYATEEDKRADLISKQGDILELEWKVPAAFYDNNYVLLPNLKMPALYFAILADDNFNDVIDNGELKIVKVVFR